MQSVVVGEKNRADLLFVRSAADLPRALREVNELLACRRSRGAPKDEVLGVVVGDPLGSALATRTNPVPSVSGAHVVLCESLELSGIWCLCAFDVSELDARASTTHRRRRRVLEALGIGSGSHAVDSDAPWLLLPVFTAEEARKDVHALVADLEARYPRVAIGRDGFVHDADQRRLVSLERYSPLIASRRMS